MGYEDTKARLAEDLITRRRAAAGATTPTIAITPGLPNDTSEAGFVRGTAASLLRGLAQVPVSGGQALQANPEADLTGGPRTLLNRAGQAIAGTAAGVRDAIPVQNFGGSEPKRWAFQGAESIPQALAYAAPALVGALAGEALNPFGGGLAGAVAGSAATYPIMQKSTYQDTYNALKEAQAAGKLKPGVTQQQIVEAATMTGHEEAAPEAGANALEALLFKAPLVGAGARVGRSVIGKTLAKNYVKSLMTEAPTEALTAATQQATINELTAEPTTTPSQAAIDSLGPTAVMAGAMAGGGTAAQSLRVLAQKAEKEVARNAAARAAGPTPRAAELLAGIPPVNPSAVVIPEGLPDLLNPAEPVMDAESFPGEADALAARRAAAEARNAAAFDTANPVVPNAPDNTPVGANPYAQFAPAPAPAFEATGLDPKTAPAPAVEPSPFASMDGPTRSAEVTSRRAADPDGWRNAFNTAARELGLTGSNTRAITVRALELHTAAQQATPDGIIDLTELTPEEKTPATGPDYTQLTPTESDQLYQERFAADYNGWMRAMNTRANRGETSDAHANRVSALARYDELIAERQANELPPPPAYQPAVAPTVHGNFSVHHDSLDDTFSIRNDQSREFVEHGLTSQAEAQAAAQQHDNFTNLGGTPNEQVQGAATQEVAPLLQDPTTGAPVSFGSEPAASGNVEDYAPADRFAGMNHTELMALRQEVPAETWNAAIRQVNPEYAEVTDDMLREAARIVEQNPASLQPDQYDDMDYQQLGQEAVRRATGENANAWDAAMTQVEAESPLGMPRAERYRLAMREHDARVQAATPQVAPNGREPVDRYTDMTAGERVAEFAQREAANPELANEAYDYAWGNAPNPSENGEITRQALRRFDFLTANPPAVTSQQVLPSWADNNATMTNEDVEAFSTLRSYHPRHFRAIKSEVETELVLAGESPAVFAPAVGREVLARFTRETTEEVQGTSYFTHQMPDGTYHAVSATDVGVGFRDRASAASYAHLMEGGAEPVPGTATLPSQAGLSQLEQTAPSSGIEASSMAIQYPNPRAFMEWLYGDNIDQQSVRSGLTDDMFSGDINDRISRAEGWPDSPAKTRLIAVLTELRAEGFQTLREVQEGFDPSTRPAPPVMPAPSTTPYVPPTPRQEPASHTQEVRDIVTAPMTPAQKTKKGKLNTLSKALMRALSDTPNAMRRDVRTEWKGAVESVYAAVVAKVDRFRYGTISAATRANPTIQGIVNDLNEYQRSIGSDMEIGVFRGGSGGTQLSNSVRESVSIKIRHGSGPWYQGISTTFGGSGSGATQDQAGHDVNRAQRQPSDGGYAYYLQHLVNQFVPGAGSSSYGMWQVNQMRRNENALSFIARYAADPSGAAANRTEISFDVGFSHGIGETFAITGGESPLTALAMRSYNRILHYYPELSRYTFDFATGKVMFEGTVIPVSALVGDARTARADRTGPRPMHEAQPHVGHQSFEVEAYSEPTFLRALITQEILNAQKKTRAVAATAAEAAVDSAVVPNPDKVRAILRGIQQNSGFTDLIFYNRTKGVQPKSELQVPALQKALAPITEALKGLIPINVIQTMAHLPGYHAGMPAFNAAYHNGAIYVVADQVSSVAEAKRLVLDHELRHAGLRQVLGKGMDTFLKQAWYAQTDAVKGFANSKGIDTSTAQGRLEAAEEYIVSLAQEAKNHPLLDRAIAKIRQLLRAIGFDLALSRAELRAMVAKAGMLKERVGAGGVTRFSLVRDSLTPAQRAIYEAGVTKLRDTLQKHNIGDDIYDSVNGRGRAAVERVQANIEARLIAAGVATQRDAKGDKPITTLMGEMLSQTASAGTRFNRTDPTLPPVDHTVAGFYRNARDKFKSMRQAARGAEWVTQLAMPIDRLIDLALLNAVYKPIHALLPVYTRLQREMQNIQDQIVGDAGRRYEKYEATCKTQAERDNFNSILRDGTLWGIFPEGGRPTWTNEEWGVKPAGAESTWTPAQKEKWLASQAFKTGLSLSEAFTDLNDRYNSMTDAQQALYHVVIKDMEKLRKRYQKSMQDFVKKITIETTLENATRDENGTVSLVAPDGRRYTAKQNGQGMWELRSGDNRVIKSTPELAQAAEGLAPQGKREKMLDKVNAKFNAIKGPYAPLSRFGDIVVNVYESTTDTNGAVAEDRVARYHFEKESDAQEFLTRMRAQDGIKATIEESAQRNSMRAQVPNEFVLEVDAAIDRMGTDGMSDEQRENLAAFGAQIKEDMGRIWLSMTPESSALKHTMKRTGLAGFDEDMMRGYVGYAQRHARGIAYLDRGVAIRETVKEMRSKIDEATGNEEDARASKRLVDHLENHEAAVRGEKISDLTQKLTRFPFLWYLSSPSVFLVQSAQPFIMTLPKLAVKFGYGKSLAAITRAYAQQANMKDRPFANDRLDRWEPTAELYVNRQAEGFETTSLTQGLSREEMTLLGMAIAVKRGQIDITMTHEAMNILKGNVKGIGDKITEKAAFLMQLSELMSRKAAFAATFEMEMERHGDFTKAVDNSVEVVRDTLYDYSRANRPGFMLGNAGRILFQFQIFRVHTLSKMLQLLVASCTGNNKKAAIKEFSMMMGNTMLAAGVSGLPFLSVAMGAFAYVFGDDDEPWDFDVYMRSVVGDGVVGDALLKGAPALLGVDVSRRIGMGSITDLFAGDPPAGVKGAQLYSYYAGKALGPLGGVASDVLFKAPEMVKQGMWVELMEQTTPKPIKDLMTGYNTMFGEGKYTGKGKLLVDSADMTIWDSVLAMGGINPTKISNAQERNYNAQKLSAGISDRRSTLQKQLQRAVISQDPDTIAAATDNIEAFNTKMPQFAITKQQIASGVKRALRKEMGLEDKNLTKVKQKYGIGEGA